MTTTDSNSAERTEVVSVESWARRWRVSSIRRVAPILSAPSDTLNTMLSVGRHPVPLALLTAAGAGGFALRPGERELVVLRATWNCGGYVPYATHAPIARALRFGRDDQAAVQHGPGDPAWTPREAALLRVVDDVQANLTVSPDVRTEARRHFAARQVMEIAATAALYEAVSMTLGSMGLALPHPLRRFLRTPAPIPDVGTGGVRRRAVVRGGWAPRPTMWAPVTADVAQALSRHPRLALALRGFRTLAASFGVLAAADHDRIVDRVGELMAGEPIAPVVPKFATGWRRPVVLRQLVDELHRDRFISDESWAAASEIFTDRELIDVCVLVGALRMQHMIAGSVESDSPVPDNTLSEDGSAPGSGTESGPADEPESRVADVAASSESSRVESDRAETGSARTEQAEDGRAEGDEAATGRDDHPAGARSVDAESDVRAGDVEPGITD